MNVMLGVLSDERRLTLHLSAAGWEIQTEEHSVPHWVEGQTSINSPCIENQPKTFFIT